jgi:hypothetical protein
LVNTWGFDGNEKRGGFSVMSRKQQRNMALTPSYHKNLSHRPPKTGLYLDFRHLDGRSRLSKSIKYVKRELRAFVGENNIIAETLIQGIAYKFVRLVMYMANQVGEDPGESDHFIPMSNSLRLDLQFLANLAGKPKQAPDLNRYLEVTYGAKDDKDGGPDATGEKDGSGSGDGSGDGDG